MQAAGAMATLAADELGRVPFELEARMSRIMKHLVQLGMAGRAGGRSHELGARNGRRRHHGPTGGGAGDQQQNPGTEQAPNQSFSGHGCGSIHRGRV